jgi:outer membrane protein assembly factor BamD (BamD/ComL family)
MKRLLTITLVCSCLITGWATGKKSPKNQKSENKKRGIFSRSGSSDSWLSRIGPTKRVQDMNFEEAVQAKDYYKAKDSKESTTKALERIVSLCTDHTQISSYIIELADMYLEQDMYEEAQQSFNQFRTLFPGSEQIQYAWYQEIRSHYLNTLDPQRDQAETQKTIELAEEYLSTFPSNIQYQKEIEAIREKSYKSLLEHELYVINFNIKQFHNFDNHQHLTAAQYRLAHIQHALLPHIQDTHPYDEKIKTYLETYKAPDEPDEQEEDDTSENSATEPTLYLAQSEACSTISSELHDLIDDTESSGPMRLLRNRF